MAFIFPGLPGGTANITRSVIRSNSAYQRGGGLEFEGDMNVTLSETTVDGNSVNSSNGAPEFGGGLAFFPQSQGTQTVRIDRSTISRNAVAGGSGGGFYSEEPLAIENSTVSGNSASLKGGGAHIANNFGASVWKSNTIYNNTVGDPGAGGGILNETGSSATPLKVHNTIVAGNRNSDSSSDVAGANLAGSSTNNLIGTGGSGGLVQGAGGNLVGIADPGLLPLANYGGRMETHALKSNSPALEAGDNSQAGTLDERGINRVADSADADTTARIDIGAVEAHPAIEDIQDTSVVSGQSLSVPFHIGDTNLGISSIVVLSSDQTKVKGSNITITGTGDQRTLNIVSEPGQVGPAPITVTVSSNSNGIATSMSDSFVLTLTGAPDLSVTKTHSGNFTQGQTGAAYTITVTNSGAGNTSGTVTVTDTPPAGLTGKALSGSGWSCTLGTLTCTRSDVLAGGSSYPAITLTVDVAANAPASVTNNVTVSGGGDTNAANNTAADATNINYDVDLSGLTISSGTLNFASNTLDYNVNVPNSVGQVSVTPTASNSTTTITVNNVSVTSGQPSAMIPLTVGSGNIVVIAVKSQDNSAEKRYTITVNRAASSNADLSNLELSVPGLSFQTGTTDYIVPVANSVENVTVTPTVADGTATVTVAGVTVASGQASGAISLGVGDNVIEVKVTAQDGTLKTYTINVKRAASSNANLGNLVLSVPGLNFQADRTDYTVPVAYSVENITVTPTVAENTANITVNGTLTASGQASSPIGLAPGSDTPVTIVVTAQNGATKTYTITVKRAAPSSNADLSDLALSVSGLSFQAGTTNYAVSVAYSVENVTVTPTVADSAATVSINGTLVASGQASSPISLTPGSDTAITIVVTAQSGATKTYTITVKRAAPSSNAELSDLALSVSGLSFQAGTMNYTVSVAYGVENVTVTPTVAENTATVTVAGVTVTSGQASGPISLSVGDNPIEVKVTAQNGATKTYTITVKRAAQSSNADLSNLVLSVSGLSFQTGTTDYTVSVAYSVENVTVTPTVTDNTATVTVNGTLATSGQASGPIGLTPGSDTAITIVVTAQSGATKTYTITVKRAAPSSNADLNNLALSVPGLSFQAGTTNYTVSVEYSVENVTVTPTVADGTATITVAGVTVASGQASGAISLGVGDNPIEVKVMAQNGTTKTYTITVKRAASSTALLSGLALTEAALSPDFNPGTTSYNATVNHNVYTIGVTPVLQDRTATLKINGVSVIDQQQHLVSLEVGTNAISIEVTAQDGTKNRYTVTVTRKGSNNAHLKDLQISNGVLTPPFKQNETRYSATVDYSVASLTVTASVYDSNATLTINGVSVTSGQPSAPINLIAGSETSIPIVVKAQNGDIQSYLLVVNRAAGNNADLSDLSLSDGITLTPPFAPGTTSYSASVSYSVRSVSVTAAVYDQHSSIKVNGVALVHGGTSDAIALSVGNNTITVEVTARDGSVKSYMVTVTRRSDDSGPSSSGGGSVGGGGDGGSQPQSSNANQPALLNGAAVDNVVTVTIEKQGNQTVATAVLSKEMESAIAGAGTGSTVTVPVTTEADKITLELNADLAKLLFSKDARLELKTKLASYVLPLKQINVDRLAQQFGTGISLSDVKIIITIAKSPADEAKRFEQAAKQNSGAAALLIPPVEFQVSARYKDKTVDIHQYETYVSREIALPNEVDPNKITTGVVLSPEGDTIYQVPTYVDRRNDRNYAVINSLTNSPYSIIWNPKTFPDVDSHWSKNIVNDMASRLIIKGMDENHFNPDTTVTRAQFAAIVVRALGLSEKGTTSLFKDVQANGWYAGAVARAVEYGIVSGYEDGTFRPENTITREEAFVIIARAMKLTGYTTAVTEDEAAQQVASFQDRNDLQAWAQTAAALSIRSGLVEGDNNKLKPKASITRAETAAMMYRLLVNAKLIR
ncbi:cadherin-like beta sandwich domain-containing protein [Paenibacillus sp. P26]|nr:cadherin-like beta sandwich domain-containing protein [Paenibacillus sp. P26]